MLSSLRSRLNYTGQGSYAGLRLPNSRVMPKGFCACWNQVKRIGELMIRRVRSLPSGLAARAMPAYTFAARPARTKGFAFVCIADTATRATQCQCGTAACLSIQSEMIQLLAYCTRTLRVGPA